MRSELLYERAEKVMPGGVNSPVRSFKDVGGTPLYIKKGKGANIITIEGKQLIDFCSSWGALLFGHARDEIVEAIRKATLDGTSFGTNTLIEVEFAEQLLKMIPCIDKLRLVNSGTEATMTALRIARGFTRRQKIIKFSGCYHGHADCLLVSAGSGLLSAGISSSDGVSQATSSEVFIASFNDLDEVKKIIQYHGKDIAAIIVEPVAANMGLILPAKGFLQGLREIANTSGALLVFDEVITGFRLGPTTYGQQYEIIPDLTCLGKIIGGGLPIGAIGGREEIMNSLAPLGNVYQAGTLSGNPVALAAGMAMLSLIRKENPYEKLTLLGACISEGLNALACALGKDMHCAQFGGLLTPFFRKNAVCNLKDVKSCDMQAYSKFFHGMLKRGFYLPPSPFEVIFISSAHTEQDCNSFVTAAEEALNLSQAT